VLTFDDPRPNFFLLLFGADCSDVARLLAGMGRRPLLQLKGGGKASGFVPVGDEAHADAL
jgi:hypothetical protein